MVLYDCVNHVICHQVKLPKIIFATVYFENIQQQQQPLLSKRKCGAARPPQKLTRHGVQACSGRYFGDADTNIFNIKILYC